MPASREISRADIDDDGLALSERILNRPRIQHAPSPRNAVFSQQQTQSISSKPVAAIQLHVARQTHHLVRLRFFLRIKIPDDHRHARCAASGLRHRRFFSVPRNDIVGIILLIMLMCGKVTHKNLIDSLHYSEKLTKKKQN